MKVVYKRPETLTDAPFSFCGGCGHGIINKILAEVMEELDLEKKSIMIWPIGCSCFGHRYFRTDALCALHGRAPAVATGIQRSLKDSFVIVYQGDGDLASEGMAEIIHATLRGEKFTVIFVNNAIFGMTGGQMAATTVIDQLTSTSPYGRKAEVSGSPVKIAELLATIDGCYYSERAAVNSPKNILAAKKAIKRAFQYQQEGHGLNVIEILSPCPTGWKMKPVKAMEWMGEECLKTYPLGVYKAPEVNE